MRGKKRADATLPLFPEESSEHVTPPGLPTPRGYADRNGFRLRRLAERGIFFGTSSWKYPGWKGQVYTQRYPSQKAFQRDCLAEYAQIFPTVCADFALYDFPDPGQMAWLHDQTPEGFSVSLKVTDRITIKKYPGLPRYGKLAGQENPDFLNSDLFGEAFLKPLERLGKKRGVIIFEFSVFAPNTGVDRERFIAVLDKFLASLPRPYAYAVEIRNREFLTAEYLAMLHRQGVAHVLNSWTRMPPIIEQLTVEGVLTAQFSTVRALLKPGRTYQEAVEKFQPYDEIREENPELRVGLVDTVRRCIAEGKQLYAYVNNRAEGNSPRTIEGILDTLDRYPEEKL